MATEQAGELVHLEVRGHAARITLDSPANRHALSLRLVADLERHLDNALGREDVRVIVLTATGTTFCAGADLRERLAAGSSPAAPKAPAAPDRPAGGSYDDPGGDGPRGGPHDDRPGDGQSDGPYGGPPGSDRPRRGGPHAAARIFQRLMGSPKPVVAAVNGHARAAGVGLVAACDIAVASAAATFAVSEVRVGLVPAVVTVPLLRCLTPRALSYYAMTGETFGAAEALRAGLLTLVVAPDELADATDCVVEAFGRCGPRALGRAKRLLDEVRGRSVEDAFQHALAVSARAFASAEAREGMRAFLDRRAPDWAAGSR